MKSISLNGSWSVRAEALDCAGEAGLQRVGQARDGWIEADVPGEVHLDLIRAGQMPEPTVGANMPTCRGPETRSWWYRTEFETDADFLRHERQDLVFDGLDLNAQVFVNGQLAGESCNAFVPASFDVKPLLRAGRNELVVRLTAGQEVAMRLERSAATQRGIQGDIAFPQEWTLFGPVAKEAPEPGLTTLGGIPAELEVGGARLTGRKVKLSDNRLDLEALLGDAPTGTTVYLLAELTLDEDAEATFGSGLLRWMKWWANGQVVFDDTSRDGDEFDWLSLDNHCFNVRLRKGRNLLAVKAVSGGRGFGWIAGGPRELRQPLIVDRPPNPMHEGKPYRHRVWPLKKWLRKPQFEYGWDWVDALPNIGIWRGVRLESRTHAVLSELRLDTVRDGAKVRLEMEAVVENLHPWSERACVLDLEIQPPDDGAAIRRQYALDVPPVRLPVRDIIEIPDAQLWWPNGMGGQPLYRIAARVSDAAGQTCDTRQFAIGLRTIEIDRSRLAEGSRFCIRVNGEEVFCRGGNLGPHDPILARISDAKYQALVAEARNANLNMLRINGCSIYEAPAFYEACDRAGIMVWQDFMLTCTPYPDDDAAFCEAIRVESEAAVLMLRHHPSLALWCGNNECTWGFRDWWNPDKSEPLQLGGVKFYNRMLPDLCRRLDPRRPYWPSTPCGGDDPNSELEGDCHWWYPFFMNADINRRIRHEVFDECRGRFVSEYGVIGPCHLDSIREYLAPGEMNPASLAWRMHTNTFENETVSAAIRRHYADPEPLAVAEYVLYGQMYQAIMHGHILEALRFRKQDPQDDCQGALIWAYSDCWGETGWSILDYYLRRKPSYYWMRRAAAPLKVIVRQRAEKLVTRLVNDTLSAVTVKVDVGWWRVDGSAREIETLTVPAAANRMCEVAMATLPAAAARDPRQWLYAAVLRDADGVAADQSVWTLAPHRELGLAAPDIRTKALADGRIEVSSTVYCHAVHVEDHGRELLSDNWFDLLPGVPVRLSVVKGHSRDGIQLNAVMPLKGSAHAL